MVDAPQYHERTKHSPESVRASGFRLDPSTKPRPYKRYENLPQVGPDLDARSPEQPVLTAIAQSTPGTDDAERELTGTDITTLCHYAAGVTTVLRREGRRIRYRAASCTGKLYHVDLYLVCGDCDGIGPGVYHYDPHEDAFDVLREGDYRRALARAAGETAADGGSSVATAPVTVVATSTWWRNAWKYRDRTYRHAFWDSGTILANLLAVGRALGRRAEVVAAFADEPVAELLGIDPASEAPLELVSIGAGEPAPDAEPVERIDPATVPASSETVDYPLVSDAWRQSTLPDGAAARAWRERFADADAGAVGTHSLGDGDLVDLDPVDAETASTRPVGKTVERRGSLREYSHESVSDRKLATVLDRALRGIPADCFGVGGADRLVDAYCLVHAVDGVPSGAYQYHPEEMVLERIGDTDRATAGHLALDQSVVGDAAVNVYLMADVDRIVDHLGNRGYRVAQLEGGIGLGRLYLATYAHLALGGRGFTFYDDLVTEHLSPRAANQTPMTLFAFGKPDK